MSVISSVLVIIGYESYGSCLDIMEAKRALIFELFLNETSDKVRLLHDFNNRLAANRCKLNLLLQKSKSDSIVTLSEEF